MNSYWNIPKIENIRTPLTVLKEQSTALAEGTKGLLIADITARQLEGGSAPLLFIRFSIKVPAINNYTFHLINIHQPLGIFPLNVDCPLLDVDTEIANMEQFDVIIKDILSSNIVGNLISNLISQAKELTEQIPF